MSSSSPPVSSELEVSEEVLHENTCTGFTGTPVAALSTPSSEQADDSLDTLQLATTSVQEHTEETQDTMENTETTPTGEEKRRESRQALQVDTENAPAEDAMSRMAHTLENINSGIQQLLVAVLKETQSNTSSTVGSDEGSTSPQDGPETPTVSQSIENQPLVAELHESNYEVRSGRNWRDMPLIPDIRKCNYQQFKEHHKAQPKHVIDVLLADSTIQNEITAWNSRFQAVGQLEQEPEPDDNRNESEPSREESIGDRWIQRVRINSTFVVRILYEMGSKDANMNLITADDAHTFLRPFSLLLHYHDSMQAKLKILCGEDGKIAEDGKTTDSAIKEQESAPEIPRQSLAELRCYVDFVGQYLMQDFNRCRNLKQPFDENEKIRFEDVTYLLYPGQLIYIQEGQTSGAKSPRALSIFPNIGRIYSVSHPTHRKDVGGWHMHDGDEIYCDDCTWAIRYYNIEFDGEVYGRQTGMLALKPWQGEKRIMDLECVPLNCMQDHEKIMERAVADGKALVNLYAQRFGFYSGWTLTNGPFGEPLFDNKEQKITSSAHIESDVLVDYHETFNTYPWWKPLFSEPDSKVPDSAMRYRTLGQSCWIEWGSPDDDIQRTDVPDRVVVSDCAAYIQRMQYLDQDPYLNMKRFAVVADEDHALLLRRFFAYSVWERKFVQLDVRSLHRTGKQENDKAFKSLQIDESHKRLIKALVQSHFRKKEVERKVGTEMETQDLIRGKGKGVIILLHGVPGVGKTATAEAIAQKWNKPLFPITCGDLGVDAETVEESLNGVFRLAHLWDCILLLDEADVFITQRERGDLDRNALVSVFLRMLEYYNGILFLTTNRPGVLDEGVKSRVHLMLRYDPLTEDQTIKVFEFNIERLTEIEKLRSLDSTHPKLFIKKNEILRFARDHFNRHGAKDGLGRWNGRQIRNAFLIASSLGQYDSDDEEETAEEGDEKLQKQLGVREFEVVEKTTLLYDEYRFKMYKQTDNERAYQREERDDDH